MGSSVSCLPQQSSTPRRQVLVMKDDGVMLRFREGSHVKDVLVAHPSHQLIKCSSDRSLLPESFRLSCSQLYFLLPKGLASYNKSIERLLRIAASRDPTLFLASGKRSADDDTNGPDNDGSTNSDVARDDNDDGHGRPKNFQKERWRPSLQTIPEATLSALLKADASPGGQRSFDMYQHPM